MIRAIETIAPGERSQFPSLLFVRVHTDGGITGHGDTYHLPQAVARFIHDYAAPQLIGQDPLAIERHWNDLYRSSARFGVRGAEMRGLSAVDVALWDILGQAADLPVFQLLGGEAGQRVPVYNTCSGPEYGAGGGASSGSRYDDLDAFLNRAGELALDLLEEGFRAMKIWPFDEFSRVSGGMRISQADLVRGLDPLERIRNTVGEKVEIMIEGHGLWSLPAAKVIARATEQFRPAWLEDLVLAHDWRAIGDLRAATSTPVVASEFLMTRI